MNNHIAINMIKSYSCSTPTPNNTYSGSTLSRKYRECATMIISILEPLPTYIVISPSTSLYLFCNSCFELLIFSNPSIKYPGATINTSKVHINNLYIKYTLVHFAILLLQKEMVTGSRTAPSIWRIRRMAK